MKECPDDDIISLMKNFMYGLAALIIACSIAYYFVIFLPKLKTTEYINQNQKGDTLGTTEKNKPIRIIEPTQDMSEFEDKLNEMQETLNQQQEKFEDQQNCENNGGKYLGSGMCCLTNCENVF